MILVSQVNVGVATDAVGVVVDMLSTKPACAMCLIPCGALSGTAQVDCLAACLPNPSCTDEEASELAPLLANASLESATALRAMLAAVSAKCANCVVETHASVCGSDGLKFKLQFYTEGFAAPRRCLPSLAAHLMADQGRRVAATVSAAEPFGVLLASSGGEVGAAGLGSLTVSLDPTDLYLPLGAGLYRGVDTGLKLFACEPTAYGHLLVVSDSDNADERAQCTGQLWIDLRSGGMYTTRPQGSDLGSLGAGGYLPRTPSGGPAARRGFGRVIAVATLRRTSRRSK